LRLSKRDKLLLFVVLAVLIVVVVWLLAALPAKPGKAVRVEDLLDFAGRFALELLGAIAGTWYIARVARHERLILDRAGIRYRSPLGGPFGALQPSWSHSWAQIRAAQIAQPLMNNPNFLAVVLDVVTAKRRIAGQWIPDGATAQNVFSWRRPTNEEALRRLEQSPLVQYLRRMGVKVEIDARARAGFGLESDPFTLGAAVAVVVLLVYAAADFAINTETYAERPKVQLFVLAGIGIFLAAAALLATRRVPRAEAIGVAMLFGVAAGGALYPGALRVNQLTDTGGLRSHQYRMKEYVVWEPRDAALPTLVFSDYYEYWEQFKPGASKEFLLRRGGLGFYQVDMAPVHAEMRKHYRNN
jgi:hypothetical protein